MQCRGRDQSYPFACPSVSFAVVCGTTISWLELLKMRVDDEWRCPSHTDEEQLLPSSAARYACVSVRSIGHIWEQ